MAWFIIGLILVVVALIIFAAAVFGAETAGEKTGGIAAAFVVGLLAVLMLVFSSVREVPARSVGVPVSVGHVGSVMKPGLHFGQAPWEKVYLINERTQTVYYDGNNCLQVRIGGQQLACWQGSVQYRVFDNAAPGLFTSYGNTGDIMDEIKNAVVTRNLQSALTHVFSDYNPILDVSKNLAAGNSQFTNFQPTLLAALKHEIGGRIDVQNLLMKNMVYNNDTQANLERIQQQFGKTAVAQEAVKTNIAQNNANSKLNAKSLSTGVLINQCETLTAEAITAHYQLPVGWNCVGSTPLALTGK